MAHFLAILTAAAVAASAPAAEDLDADFLIYRKGKPIGRHVVIVEERFDGVHVDISIEMGVNFGPLPLYRYMHRSTEVWRDGALVSVRSRTNDNGDRMRMKAWRVGDALHVDGDAYQGVAPAGAAISSYWNRSALQSADTLLSTQDGALIEIDASILGQGVAPSGERAEHLRIAGTVALELYYSRDRWTGANFVIDGEELTYIPAGIPPKRRSGAPAGSPGAAP